jgi:hypothetical protein
MQLCVCQENENSGSKILFHGIVMDANSQSPIPNTQILINNNFSSLSASDGTFSFYLFRSDTVLFKHLGHKSTLWFVSDTLAGNEFLAGIYMPADTVSIGEVIIVPRFNNLKSEIMNAPSKEPATMENARYNVAVSAYAGRTTTGKLGDPASNYGQIRQQQKVNAYEKGGIPSDQISGFSPLLILPAAYLLIHGTPEKPGPFEQKMTKEELAKIQKKYLELMNQQK